MNIHVKPRNTTHSIEFPVGGYYFLKNDNFTVAVAGTGDRPLRKGHIHLDMGSYTLSHGGIPIVVDPGSKVYTRNKLDRDTYRSIRFHNVAVCPQTKLDDKLKYGYFSLNIENKFKINSFTENAIQLVHDYFDNQLQRTITITDNDVHVRDHYKGMLRSYIHLHPLVNAIIQESRKLVLGMNGQNVEYSANVPVTLEDYMYSEMYDHAEKSSKLMVTGNSYIEYTFRIIQI
jgi:hypothetical protein